MVVVQEWSAPLYSKSNIKGENAIISKQANLLLKRKELVKAGDFNES